MYSSFTLQKFFLDAPYCRLTPAHYEAVRSLLPRVYRCSVRAQTSIVHCICAALPGGPQQQLQYLVRHPCADMNHLCVNEDLYPHMQGDTSAEIERVGLSVYRRSEASTRIFWESLTPLQVGLGGVLPPERRVRQLVAELGGRFLALRPRLLLSWHPVGIPPLDAALWAALLVGVPHILVRFNSISPLSGADASRMPPWLTEQMRFLVREERMHLCANAYAGGKSIVQWLDLRDKKISIIPNGFDSCRGTCTVAEQADFRAVHGIPAEAPLLAGVFRLNAGKNIQDFLRIVQNLAARIPDLYILHAGGGPESRCFHELLGASGLTKKMRHLGPVGQGTVDRVLSCADVLLGTSAQEGLSNVWLEAMFHGAVPVVADAGDALRVIPNGKCGFVHAQGDVLGMTESLYVLLKNASVRVRMAEAGRQRVMQNYSLATYAATMQQKIRESLER